MAERKSTPNDPLNAAGMPIGGAVVGGSHPRDDDRMTDVQAAELRALCKKHDEPMDGNLTQQQAADRIEALKAFD